MATSPSKDVKTLQDAAGAHPRAVRVLDDLLLAALARAGLVPELLASDEVERGRDADVVGLLAVAELSGLDVVEDASLRKGHLAAAHAASTATRQLLRCRIFAALGPPLPELDTSRNVLGIP